MNKVYPTFDELSNVEDQKEWVPESLPLLLSYLIPSELKQVTIGKCVTPASRPRTIICPVTFGLDVQVETSHAAAHFVTLETLILGLKS